MRSAPTLLVDDETAARILVIDILVEIPGSGADSDLQATAEVGGGIGEAEQIVAVGRSFHVQAGRWQGDQVGVEGITDRRNASAEPADFERQ